MANGSYNPLAWNYSSASTWGYMAGGAIIGCVSGGVGYGVGAAASGALGQATTMGGAIFNGAVAGAAGGAAGGLVGGSFSAWSYGASFGDGLATGCISAGIGGFCGAILGGIGGGLKYRSSMQRFAKGNKVLDVTADESVPQTVEFVKVAQKAWYPDAPMDKVKEIAIETLGADQNGATSPFTASHYEKGILIEKALTGNSKLIFDPKAFASARQLFFTMGHEFIHVSQYAVLAGMSYGEYSKLVGDGLKVAMDFYAYQFEGSLRGTSLQFGGNAIKNSFALIHPDYFSKLANTNFGWTYTASFNYTFY
jgi:hypothetical protein